MHLYLPGQNSSETDHEADWKTGNLPSSSMSQTGAKAFDRRVAGEGKVCILNLRMGEGRRCKEGMGWDLTFRNSLSSWGG
jgi:hypothetical protein